jgi:hypothetical protein
MAEGILAWEHDFYRGRYDPYARKRAKFCEFYEESYRQLIEELCHRGLSPEKFVLSTGLGPGNRDVELTERTKHFFGVDGRSGFPLSRIGWHRRFGASGYLFYLLS